MPKRFISGKVSRARTPYLVLAIGIFFTAVASYYVRTAEEARDRLRFQRSVERAQANIRSRLDTYVALLRSSVGFMVGSREIDREEFSAFVGQLMLRERYPGILGIGFSARVRPHEREALEARMRREGFADFRIWPDDARDEYTSIIYLEPMDRRNRAAIGYDMFSEPVRREAMERARDTGQPAASARVTLVQEIDEQKQAGFLVYAPFYRGGATPSTVEERREALLGFAYSPFRAGDLFSDILGQEGTADFSLSVTDESSAPGLLLYGGEGVAATPTSPRFKAETLVEVGGRTWRLDFSSTPDFDARGASPAPLLILLAGLFGSLVVFQVLRQQAAARAAAERAAADLRESERRTLESLRRQEVIAEIGRAALSDSALEEFMNEAARLTAATLGVEYSAVLRLAPDGESFDLCAGIGWREGIVGVATVEAGDNSHAGHALLSDTPIVINDCESEQRFNRPQLLAEHGIRSGIVANISGKERPFGAISAYSTRPHAFTDEDVHFLQSVANALGSAFEHRRSEEALRESERDYRGLFESAHDAIIIFDPVGEVVLDVNRMACEVYGLTREKFIGMSMADISPDADRGRERIIETLRAGAYLNFETRQLRKGGEEMVLEVNASVVSYKGRQAILSINRDVTERRRVERALAESEARLRRMPDSGVIGIIFFDTDGRINEANDYFLNMVGYDRADLARGLVRWDTLTPPEYKVLDELAFEQLQSKGVCAAFEKEYTRKDGTRVPVLIGAAMLPGEGEQAVAFVLDNTARKRAEEALRASETQLAQAQKMESVGRLAGGIAHDFNNLLAVITLHVDLMLRETGHEGRLARRAEEIKRSAERAAALTRQLLAFSRKQVLQPKVVCLNEALLGIDRILRSLLADDIHLLWSLDPTLGKVLADPGQIEQVVLNLAVNARDAMPHGGTLKVSTQNARLDTKEAESAGAAGGGYVMLSITDTGCGMDAETQSRIFEPFFTTKEMGKGTGLGLSTVYGIVAQSGGHIEVESEVGRGTTFRVYLPRVDDVARREEAVRNADDARREISDSGTAAHRETILLVDDEAALRGIAADVLEMSGYRLLTAGDGAEALRLFESTPERIDLLLTDVVMPRMSGRELARRLTELRPEMKVLYMSGYIESPMLTAAEEEGLLLHKPFLPHELVNKVREILDS